jgi:hypothetical protein
MKSVALCNRDNQADASELARAFRLVFLGTMLGRFEINAESAIDGSFDVRLFSDFFDTTEQLLCFVVQVQAEALMMGDFRRGQTPSAIQ